MKRMNETFRFLGFSIVDCPTFVSHETEKYRRVTGHLLKPTGCLGAAETDACETCKVCRRNNIPDNFLRKLLDRVLKKTVLKAMSGFFLLACVCVCLFSTVYCSSTSFFLLFFFIRLRRTVCPQIKMKPTVANLNLNSVDRGG